MIDYVYLVPLLPLLGFLINGLGWRVVPKGMAGWIGSLMVLLAFGLSLGIFTEVQAGGSRIVTLYPFIQTSTLNIPFAFQVDHLSALFLLIITGIGSLIHIYSVSYMHDDPGVVRYFAYLNLFVFSMLLLVLGANYLIMFIGWEGVGLCSYLLIGFWFKNRDYGKAAKKAFVMNRIGDLGFLVGMMLTLYHFGTLNYGEFFPKLAAEAQPQSVYFAIAICFFIGATGKSAQLPLYTWLPDAMAGPTPVSALIHAATMVTAGIYMVARSSALYNLSLDAQNIMAVVGLATALLAGSIALRQWDIKKVLAYSTVSQLGFMVLALGVGAYTTAVFHVLTHAFFKALLFLGSGSVIHAMGGEQDIRKMGGLAKKMPITNITFLIGCLALAGIPGLSGFFSKDEILASAFGRSPIFYGLGIVAAAMTAFYSLRLYTLTFTGGFRGTHEQEHHLHESPALMTLPLIILAVLAVVGGYIGLPPVISEHHTLHSFLSPVVANAGAHELSHGTEWMLIGISSAIAILFAVWGYLAQRRPAFNEATGINKALENKWYVDEAYDAAVVKPVNGLSRVFNDGVEKLGIDGVVNGVGKGVRWGGDRLRLLQNGQVGYYLFVMVVGMTLLLAVGFFWK
ncbi:MAG: NADH-quinone oxidoreductase subunit L [Sphingobacteriales bacterium]|nr:MAG: NADH-quinone oxidoreductase subunit L [Sphingobacteriales bacterium]